MGKVKASVTVIGFFEVAVDVPDGEDANVTGARARELAKTLPIRMEVDGPLPQGVRVLYLQEDDEREHIDWGEVR